MAAADENHSSLLPGDVALASAIARATRRAVEQLHAAHPGPFCVYALATTGEALRPYLIVTPDDETRWDLPDSPFAVYGDGHLAGLEELFTERGDLFGMTPADADAEYSTRLASMESALRSLDDDGLFGTGDARRQVLLLVTTMPPDASDAAVARRLNQPGRLMTAWLEEASEGGAAAR